MTGQLEEVTSSTPTTPPDWIIEDRFQRQGWKQTHEGISYHSSNPRKITTRHYYLGNTRLILPPGGLMASSVQPSARRYPSLVPMSLTAYRHRFGLSSRS
ncbi:hypothetical protein ACU8V3_03295 [Cobetia marina]